MTALYEDRRGKLWVGNIGALCYMQGTHYIEATLPFAPDVYKWVVTMHEDRQGNFWIGTTYGGLLKGRPTETGYEWTHFTTGPAPNLPVRKSAHNVR